MKKQVSVLFFGLSVLLVSTPLTANVALSQESNTVVAQSNSNSLEDKVFKRVRNNLLKFYAAEPAEQEQYTNKTLSLLLENGLITQVEANKLRPIFLAGGQGKVEQASNFVKELKEVATSDLVVNIFDYIESDSNDPETQSSTAGDVGAVIGGALGAAGGFVLGELPGAVLGAKLGSDAGRALGEIIADATESEANGDGGDSGDSREEEGGENSNDGGDTGHGGE